jgi:MoxR-like ATPase
VNFETLSLVLESLFGSAESNFPVMLCGRHGIGKSEIVYQLGVKLVLKVVERRLSQQTEGDLMGIPSIDRETYSLNSTKWNHPDWYIDCHENARILFFDELDRASKLVRQGVMEIADSRKFHGLSLHPDTIVIAACNGGKHGSDYQVAEMGVAELDRWAIYDVEPTVNDWLNYAKGRVHPIMLSFIEHNNEHLEHKGPFELGKVYPSRRSVFRLDTKLRNAGIYDDLKNKLDLLYNISKGFIGVAASVALQGFVLDYEGLLTAEDIVDAGLWKLTEDWDINKHLAMTKKISNSGILRNKLSETKLRNVANYFIILPSEAAASFWVLFCGKEKDNFHNVNLVPFHQTIACNGRKIADYYSELLTGTNTQVI